MRRFIVLVFLLPVLASAQDSAWVAATYSKAEYMVPMRDGISLYTAVYSPRNNSTPYPLLLVRTPYSCNPYGAQNYPSHLGPGAPLMHDGYIFVYQDVRGKYMSEGEFVDVRPFNPAKKGRETDEASDSYDTFAWLLNNIPNNNGKIGMWGISYPGFYVTMGILSRHPALVAASPQAPIADWFLGDDFHHNGAFFLPHAFNFYRSFGLPRPGLTTKGASGVFQHGTPDGYDFFLRMGSLANANTLLENKVPFWAELMQHGTYDAYWQQRTPLPHLTNVTCAVMTVGGWFDAEDLYGALATYRAIETQNPGIFNILVMGPWSHGAWGRSDGESLGPIRFYAKTSQYYRLELEHKFFNALLKEGRAPDLPEATLFETGANQWKTYPSWPPRMVQEESYYFNRGFALTASPQTERHASDEYTADPAKPVPFTNAVQIGMHKEYMVEDQRFASTRPDVLTYVTPVFASDVTYSCQPVAELYMETTGSDADYIVKIIDVFPNDTPDSASAVAGVRMGGYQMLLRGEVMRAKFRNSFSRPEPMVPGQPEKVEFTLPGINHTFKAGHRLMVQVQSHWFPLVDRNPQLFTDIYKAKITDFHKESHKLHRSLGFPSRIIMRRLLTEDDK